MRVQDGSAEECIKVERKACRERRSTVSFLILPPLRSLLANASTRNAPEYQLHYHSYSNKSSRASKSIYQ